MKSNWKAFLIIAAIGFALGGAFALFRVEVKEQAVQETPAPEAPSAEIVAEPPVLEGVPPMPEMADIPVPSAPEPPTAPAVAGVPPMPPGMADIPPAPPAPAVAGVPVGGAFALTDHKGNAVTEKSWPGKHKLVFFGFTNCPDICPAALQKMAAVMENYDAKGEKLAPLFITVDPTRDTQAVMAAYVAGYNPNIIGLTGTPEQVKAAEDAYKVYASPAVVPAGAAPMTDHSSYVYLMSPDDKLLEVFGSAETAESIIAKIKLHL